MNAQAVTIRPATIDEREVAVRLALAELDDEQKAAVVASLLPMIDGSANPFASLSVGVRSGQIQAAAWVQPQAGCVGTLWVNAVPDQLPGSKVVELIATTLSAVDGTGLDMIQLLVDPADTRRAKWFEQSGMSKLAHLKYLEWFAEWTLPNATRMQLNFAANAGGDSGKLGSLLLATYEHSLDCPPLCGLRSIEETIAGYQSAGDYDPNLWFVVRNAENEVGVLLLTPYNELHQWELTYVGIVPFARGLGLGRQIVTRAQQMLRDAKVDRLVLAVDAENLPAMEIYRAQHFRHWADRVAWYHVPKVGQ